MLRKLSVVTTALHHVGSGFEPQTLSLRSLKRMSERQHVHSRVTDAELPASLAWIAKVRLSKPYQTPRQAE